MTPTYPLLTAIMTEIFWGVCWLIFTGVMIMLPHPLMTGILWILCWILGTCLIMVLTDVHKSNTTETEETDTETEEYVAFLPYNWDKSRTKAPKNTPGQSKPHALNLSHCKKMCELAPISGCSHLRKLDLTKTAVTGKSFEHLKGCTSLHTLIINACRGVTDVVGLGQCPSLSILSMQSTHANTLWGLEKCPKLRKVDCSGSKHLKNIDALENALELKVLDLTACTRLKSVACLLMCGALTDVNLTHCHVVVDAHLLIRCPEIRTLGVASCHLLTWGTVNSLMIGQVKTLIHNHRPAQ